MRRAHLLIGILLFTAFTVTGRYMRLDFPDKYAIPPELRILMRSRHIYILFNSLVFLITGVYFRWAESVVQKVLQAAGSSLLLASAILLIYAWYVESYQIAGFSNLSRYGIYLSLAAVGLHLVGGLDAEAARSLFSMRPAPDKRR